MGLHLLVDSRQKSQHSVGAQMLAFGRRATARACLYGKKGNGTCILTQVNALALVHPFGILGLTGPLELISRNMATSPSNLSFDGENSLPGPVVKLLSEEVRPSNSLKSPIGPGNSEPLGPTACLVEAFEGLSQVNVKNTYTRTANPDKTDGSGAYFYTAT